MLQYHISSAGLREQNRSIPQQRAPSASVVTKHEATEHRGQSATGSARWSPQQLISPLLNQTAGNSVKSHVSGKPLVSLTPIHYQPSATSEIFVRVRRAWPIFPACDSNLIPDSPKHMVIWFWLLLSSCLFCLWSQLLQNI